MRQIAAVLLALTLSAASAFAQKPPATAPDPSFGEAIEVRVINVDVIVTDRQGQPVTGLTAADFDLYENGQKRTISNFFEARSEASKPPTVASKGAVHETPSVSTPAEAPQDLRSRKLVFFVDALSISLANRSRVLPHLEQFVKQIVRPNDQVMIVVWKPGLSTELPLTADTNKMSEAVKHLGSMTTLASMGDLELKRAEQAIANLPGEYALHPRKTFGSADPGIQQAPIQDGLNEARGYAQQVLQEQNEKVGAVKAVISLMRGMEGRKALILVTESLAANPGLPIYLYLEQMKDQFANGNTVDFRAAAQQFEDHELVTGLTTAANAAGVTFYAIDPGGLGTQFSGINAESSGNTHLANMTGGLDAAEEGVQSLRSIAAATGGTALTSSNNFQLAFDQIASDLQSYYSLGYRAEGERKDAVRGIEVKLRGNHPGLSVRARHDFVEKSLGSEMGEAVSANLFFPVSRNDLQINAKAAAPQPAEAEKEVVQLDVKIPTASLTFVPDGTDVVGSFTSYYAFVRADGQVSEIKVVPQKLRFPAESMKRRKELTARMNLTIDPKTEGVSVGVMDDLSHATGFVAVKLETPAVVPVTRPATGGR